MKQFKRRRYFGSLFQLLVRLLTPLIVACEETKSHGHMAEGCDNLTEFREHRDCFPYILFIQLRMLICYGTAHIYINPFPFS